MKHIVVSLLFFISLKSNVLAQCISKSVGDDMYITASNYEPEADDFPVLLTA